MLAVVGAAAAVSAVIGCSDDESPTAAARDLDPSCDSAAHPWQTDEFSRGESSGDGLPPSGTATRAAAEALLADHGDELIERYAASSVTVVVENGAAWVRRDGRVAIVEEEIGVVELHLASTGACPQMPSFYDGVPLSFVVRG